MKKFLLPILCFLVVLFAFALCTSDDSSSETTSESSSDSSLTKEDPQLNKAKKTAWEYHQSIDEMTDKTTYYASIESENEVEFDFPYNGGSSLTLTIRNSPQYGKNIYIKISKGQFNPGINGTNIKVRFDDNEPIIGHCIQPSDYSTDLLFIDNYNKVLNKIKESRTMKINAEFFSEGTRTFNFKTEGLEWDH
ncbi:MAG: hypothetical protein K2N08_08620 [Muribaculaceae bacterium]|nr:hypothetical protein [Muribaculaceae bacterium]